MELSERAFRVAGGAMLAAWLGRGRAAFDGLRRVRGVRSELAWGRQHVGGRLRRDHRLFVSWTRRRVRGLVASWWNAQKAS